MDPVSIGMGAASLAAPIIGKPKGAPKSPTAMPQASPSMLTSTASQPSMNFTKPAAPTPQSYAVDKLKGM